MGTQPAHTLTWRCPGTDHLHLSASTGKRTLNSANTASLTAAMGTQPHSHHHPACQHLHPSESRTFLEFSKEIAASCIVLGELKMLKLLQGSATASISFYRIEPIPVHAANYFLEEDILHSPAIYFHHID